MYGSAVRNSIFVEALTAVWFLDRSLTGVMCQYRKLSSAPSYPVMGQLLARVLVPPLLDCDRKCAPESRDSKSGSCAQNEARSGVDRNGSERLDVAIRSGGAYRARNTRRPKVRRHLVGIPKVINILPYPSQKR